MSDDEWVRKMYRLLGTTPSEVHLREFYNGKNAADYSEAAELCLKSTTKWNEWETGFLTGLHRFPYLSEAQTDKLKKLCRRCHVRWQP